MTRLVRERASVLCMHDGNLLCLEMEDPVTHKRYWTFPGGEIEPGESPADCAIRETLEESGYRVTLNPAGFTNNYLFRWNGKTYDCRTHWFRAELESTDAAIVDDADYILRCEWLAWPRCRQLFLFNPGMQEALDQLLGG